MGSAGRDSDLGLAGRQALDRKRVPRHCGGRYVLVGGPGGKGKGISVRNR